MIGHFLEIMARAVLGALGISAGPRRIGRCFSCHTLVFSDDDYTPMHGGVVHDECIPYVRRAAA